MIRTLRNSFALAFTLILVAHAQADFRVNTVTSGTQWCSRVAMDDLGNFVVVWERYDSQTSNSKNVYARLYDGLGRPRTREFQVNTSTDDSRSGPCVAMHGSGSFVVAWQSLRSDGGDLCFRRFAADGTPLTGELLANSSYLQTYAQVPQIAMNAAGEFVIIWKCFNGPVHHAWGLVGQAFFSDGTRRGTGFEITDPQPVEGLAVAIEPSGDFVLAWSHSYGSLLDPPVLDQGVHVRHYHGDGAPKTPSRTLDLSTDNHFGGEVVGVDASGNSYVTWVVRPPEDHSVVKSRRFHSDGSDLGTPIVYQDPPPSISWLAWLAVTADGRGLLCYSPQSSVGGSSLRWLNQDGSLNGPELCPVSYVTSGYKICPTVAVSGNGEHAVVVWGDQDTTDVYARVVLPRPTSANDWQLLQ